MKEKRQLVAILSVAFVSLIRGSLNPGMEILYQHYSSYSHSLVSLVTTLPSLTVIPSSYIFGRLTGRKISYKNATILMNALLLIGGAFPFFFQEIYQLLFFRLIFGIGVGIAITIHKPLIIATFQDNRQSRYLGYASVIASLGMMFFQTLSGYLAEMNWNYIFLSFLPLCITFLLSFFIPDIELQKEEDDQRRLFQPNGMVYLFMIVFMLLNMCGTCFGINMTSLIAGKGIERISVSSSHVMNVNSICSMISGLMFGFLYEKDKKKVLYLSLFVQLLSLIIFYAGSNVITLYIASGLYGLSYNIVVIYIFLIFSHLVDGNKSAISGGYMSIAAGIGGFMASMMMQCVENLFGEVIYSTIFIYIFILVLFVIFVRMYLERKL